MDVEEIKASGLLELYVMDQLSPAGKAEVEGYLNTYPELRKELREIERSLEIFAGTAALKSPAGTKEKVLDAIRGDVNATENTNQQTLSFWPLAAAVFGIGLLLFVYLYVQKNKDTKRLEQDIAAVRETCVSNTNALTKQLDLLRQLTEPANKILPFTATPGFASTDIYLHTNKISKRNFIQVRNLPDIASGQTYELWSIKPNQAPIPLNVFDKPSDGLIEVSYVDGTEVYAITIEPSGGKNTPTMENLIGTVSVAGI
ncbi:MAG TPA: anti-sigma factor [Saprospiraceae bacterium]|nr:anti-sigma factor [Saprospiraceae bacterium]